MRALKINSSSDMSSDSEYHKQMHAFNTIGTQQPMIVFAQNCDRSYRESRNRSQEIAEVTKDSTIVAGESTLQRRVTKSKGSEEETITYHLKLHPDSMKYTFSTTEPRKVSYYTEQQLLARPGTSGFACHSRMMELPHRKSNALRNSNNLQCRGRSNEVRMYEEKSTYCRPVVNLHTAEFVKKTIDKNNRLRSLVRDIVEAREEGKKRAWNNFINDLKTKHGYNYYAYDSVYVPKKYQLEPDNILSHYNLPGHCGTVRSWPNDNYNPPKKIEYIKRPYPNDILCYPISSAAHMKLKNNRLSDSPIPNYLTTDCIIKQNPRKRKRRHALAQTSIYRMESRQHTFKPMKDESEGGETCVCFAAVTMDEYTITDSTGQVEHATATNLEGIGESSHGSGCFCKKDKATAIHSELALSENEKKIRTCSIEVDTILKDFMKKDEESNINVSARQSDDKKINSKSQYDEIIFDSAAQEKEGKYTLYKNLLSLTAREKEERDHQSSCNSESKRDENLYSSSAQEKEGKKQISFHSETKQDENILSLPAQEKEYKNHVRSFESYNLPDEKLFGSSAREKEERNQKSSCSGQVHQDNNILSSYAQEKNEKNHQSSLKFDSHSQQDENLLGSSVQEKEEKNHQSTFNGHSQHVQNLLCSSAQEKEEKTHQRSIELMNKATYLITVAKNLNQFEEPRDKCKTPIAKNLNESEEPLEEYKTSPNPLGKIEEKLDKVISTMNHLLYEVQLRMLDINIEKFDTATSTVFPNIAEEHETCIAFSLLEAEINNNDYDNSDQKEKYNKDLFKSDDRASVKDNTTINVAHINSFPASMNNAIEASISRQDPPALILGQSNTKASNLEKLQIESYDEASISRPDPPALTLGQSNIKASNQKKLQNESSDEASIRRPGPPALALGQSNIKTSNQKKLQNENSDEASISRQDPPVLILRQSDTKATYLKKLQNETYDEASLSRPDPPALTLGQSNIKAFNQRKLHDESFEHLVSQRKTISIKMSDKDTNSSLGENFSTTPKYIEDRLSAVDQSIIDIKKVSKSFMEDLLRSKQNLTDANYDVPATSSKEQNQQTTTSVENIVNRNLGNIKINNKAKNRQFCCVVTNISGMQRPQYRHASVTNTAEILMEDDACSNDPTLKKRHPHTHVPVEQAVFTVDKKTIETRDKCNSTKLLIAVDRAVSRIDENLFSKNNYQHNCILVDRAVSKIDDIILEEMRKSNQAKKDINDLLNRQFTNNYGVQITFEMPTKERSTEVTDSLSKALVSNKSSSKIFFSSPPSRSPLTITAVNTDPMSLQGLFRLSAETMRQMLGVIYSGYSSYLPSVGRTLPMVGEAVQYLCHVCGAAFRRPSDLSNHMRGCHMDSSRDCCVCRHMLQMRERSPGVFACRFCGQMFTRAYCCELHERSCLRRGGRNLDVSESRAILK